MKRTKLTKGYSVWWLIVIAFFAGGIITGMTIDRVWTDKRPLTLVEKREGGYAFINPLLECEGSEGIINDPEVRPFQGKIESYINEVVNKKRTSEVSVYFRDLTNGPAFGVNEDDRFAPASLFKVPTMIAYFKMAESRPELLKEQLVYDGKEDLNGLEHFKSPHAIEPGKRYTIEELIKMMIVYSDNNANRLLYDHMDREFMKRVYEDLGIAGSTFIGRNFKGDFISVEEYTSCFRFLFNSSYLNREMSERALRYLAQSEFPYGITAGVPHGIYVAQKYGERTFEGTNVKELHDCGIVYYPTLPYLLCVMTKGTDFDVLADTIRNISALVYNEVDRHQGAQQTERGR